ncbi:phage tail length tape measure family protein [Azospirillum melinis]|uniref:phage tail length tape measure family protein n=1 Tax=Azospirillum melinis TaxID=328839 RepID=UPI003757651E
MSDTLTLGIAVDAAPAETGAGKVTAAYRAIEQRADAMANAVSRADAAMNRLGSGSAFDRVTRQIAGGASGVDAMATAMERAERVEKAMQQAMSSMADASAKQTAAINTMNAALEKLLNTRKNLNDVPKPKPAVDETEAQALDRITQRMQAAKAAREAQTQATTQQKAAQDALNASVAAGAGGQVSNAGLLATAKAAQDATVSVEKLTKARLDDEAASNALVKSADTLVGKYAPMIKAQQQLANDRAALTKLQKEGTLTATEEAAVIAGLEAKQRNLDNMQKTLGGSTKAQAQHFQNLKYQINDVVTGFISGQPPMMIFAQQGGQIVQALDGMDMGLSKVKASTWALAGTAVATVAILATVGTRIASISSEAKQLDTITKVLNPNLGATAEQLRNISFAVADQGTSRATGMAALTAVIKDARIQSTALAEEIAKVSVDVAAVMGGEVPDWAKKIADAASAGSQGFDKLMSTLPGITAETMKAVRAAEQHGDRLGAAKIAVDALEKQYGGSAKAMQGAWDEAIHQMGRTFDDFLEKIAKSNPAQGLANFMRDAAKGMGWWVNGVPAEIQNATDRTALSGILDRETASLKQLVEGGASGEVLDRQKKKVQALQEQYYGLAAAASAAASAQVNAAGGGNGGTGGSSIGGQIAGLNEDDRNKLNLAASSTERQAAASKLLSGALSVQARAAAENRIALADMAMQYPALGAGTAETILKSKDFSATLKTLPPELQAVYKQMESNSANKLAGDVAQAGVALSSASNAAKLNAEAAGLGEAAMRRASIEAEVYAHRMDGTAGAVRDALEEQEKFAQSGIWNSFSRGIDQQVAANDRMIAAYGKSDKAVEEASRYNEAYLQTLKEYPESMKDLPAYEDLWTVALNRNIEKLKERDLNKLAKDVAAYTQALRRSQDDLKIEKIAAGLSDAAAIDLKARYDALKAMGLTIEKYGELDEATRRNVDINLDGAAAIAKQQQEVQNYKSAWDTVNNSLEKSFERIGDALVDAIVQGKDASLDFGKLWKSIAASMFSDFAKLASVDLRRAIGLGGGTQGSLLDLFSGPSASGGSAAGGGLTGSLTNTALSQGGSWAMDQLGITGGMSGLMNTPLWAGSSGIAPGFVDVVGSEAIANTAAMTGGGATLGGVLGSAGAGALGGALGGMIGTATNSKAIGGLSGAALGAGSAGLASLMGLSAVGGPIGLAIGAVVGGIMGLLGTQKATVGKTASADVTINAGGKSATYGNIQTDNEGDPAAGKALGNALSGIFSIAAMGGGSLTKDFGIGQTAAKGLYVGGSVPYKEFGKGDNAIGDALRYMLLDQGGLKDGGVNTVKALKATKAADWEEAAKDIGLGASIDAGNTALKEFDKTLGGVTRSAKETTADSLKPMLEEFERSKKLGISDAYKGLASDRLKSYLDVLKSPVEWTATEQAVASATGQFQAMREAFVQLDPAIVTTIDAIEKETKARIARDLNKSLDQQTNEAGGKGYVNSINGFLETLNANARSLAAVGEPATKAQGLFNTSLNALLKTLSGSQLDDIAKTFGGDIGALAKTIKATSDATKEFATNISGRLAAALGNTRGSSLIALDAQQAKELKDARDAGLDTTQLVALQGVERAKSAFDLAQQDVMSWYDKEIASKQEYITTLQDGAVKIAEAAKKFKSAFDDLALNDNSPLAPIDKLKEARTQFDTAYGIAKSGTATDTEKQDAQQKLVSLGPQLIQIAKSYYASSDSSDYQHVRDVYKEFGDLQALGVDKADESLKTAQSQLKELQKARTDASQIGQRQLGALSDLKSVMDQSYLLWQSALPNIGGGTNTAGTGTKTTPTYVDNRLSRLQAFTNADIESNFGSFSDIIAARSKDPSFNLAEWFQGAGIAEVLSGQRKIPGFATGTDSAPPGMAWVGENGRELVQMAGGERVYPHSTSMAIANSWGAANDRWGGGNVVEYRRPSSNNSGGSSADLKRQNELLEEQNRLLTAILRTTAASGDGTHAGLAEVATNVKAVAKKASGGGLRE